MHIIELLIYRFLSEVALGKYVAPEALLEKFSVNTVAHLKRQLEREPKTFTLRMSNLGRNLCQLECEQAGIKGISWDNNSITRNTFGDICEDVLMFMLHAAGVPIVSEQEPVELEIAGQKIKGTLDLVILTNEGVSEVWDIKSASDWTFKNKFTLPFDKFLEEDSFGYVDQLFLYGQAKGCPVGGIIVQNKSTGEILVMEFPPEQQLYREAAIARATAKVNILSKQHRGPILQSEIRKSIPISAVSSSSDAEPAKHNECVSMGSAPSTKFSPVSEYFRSKPTGNLILNPKCTFCDYKFHCFPEVQLKANPKSTARVPQMNYYTEMNNG